MVNVATGQVREQRHLDPFSVLSWVLAIGLLALIVLPILAMFVRAFSSDAGTFDPGPLLNVLADPTFHRATINTVIVLLSAGAAALLIGSLFAWLNERTDARFGTLSTLLPIVPLFMPPIAMSVGWLILGQPRSGFLNGFLRVPLHLLGLDIQVGPIDIGTWPGLVFVYTISLMPYVYLVMSAALRNMDTSLEEASRMAGAGPLQTALRISFPAVRPAIASAALLILIVGVSAFSVPRTIGTAARIDVISVYLVRLTQTVPSRLDESVAVSGLLLVVIAAAWLFQGRLTRGSRHATISGKSSKVALVRLGRWRWIVRLAMIGYLLTVTLLPFLALFVLALQPFWQAVIDPSKFTLEHFQLFFFEPSGVWLREGLLNSVRLGLAGATLCMAVAAVLVTYAGQRRGWQSSLIGGVTKIPGAISNLVIGVSLLIALSGPPFRLGGTLIILLLGYLVAFMPQASIAAEAARKQVGDDLLESSYMHGGSRFRTFRSILLPLMGPGLQAGWALVFVVIVGDFTVSALLSGPRNLVVGAMFLNIWDSGTFANLATLGTVVCLTTSLVAGVVLALRRGRPGRRNTSAPAAGAPLST